MGAIADPALRMRLHWAMAPEKQACGGVAANSRVCCKRAGWRVGPGWRLCVTRWSSCCTFPRVAATGIAAPRPFDLLSACSVVERNACACRRRHGRDDAGRNDEGDAGTYGRLLEADRVTVFIYVLVHLGALVRVAAPFLSLD
jgi:hypothetical protein